MMNFGGIDYQMRFLGCGACNETYLNGWITAFSAYDESGHWQKERSFTESNEESNIAQWLSIRTSDITPGIVHVPINIHDEFAEPWKWDYTGAIITGHMGYLVKNDEKTLQSMSGWAMAITNEPPHYLAIRSQ